MSKDLENTKPNSEIDAETSPQRRGSVAATPKGRWEKLWPVIACGAGLFSDGYLNNIIGSVNTMLSRIYGPAYDNSSAQSNVSSIAFAGTVLGMLVFGYTSDHYSRKWSLFASTIIIIVFAALGAGSYGAGGSVGGLLAALTAYRFLLGIGIGGEYPAGSVGCSESTGELEAGTRNRWFIMFTNVQIDLAFVISALVAMIVVLATTEKHLRAAWRICLALGVIPPLSLLYLRIKLQEPEAFKRESMAKTKTPWLLVIKYYWFRLVIVSTIWFIYDFSSYAFGLYASYVVDNLLANGNPDVKPPLWKTFGWNTVINLFYMPGCIAGAYISDWIGPKRTLALGVFLQAIIGFIMAGCYSLLDKPENVGGFVVVYGVFLAFGELGPGDNIGLVASKTSATSIRGQYYGLAAAMGKIGAFVGSWVFPILVKRAPQDPFWVASPLAIVSGVLALTLLPNIEQDTIDEEDRKFREYLLANGYDTSAMGLKQVLDEAPSQSSVGKDGVTV